MRKKHAAESGGTDWAAAPAGRITPMDVQQKEFGVARFGGGYRMREVDEFLDQITDALSALIAENERLSSSGAPSRSDTRAAEAPRPAGDVDRAGLDAFLQREKGFLQSLGGLVQEHAEGLKEMVRVTRQSPAPAVADTSREIEEPVAPLAARVPVAAEPASPPDPVDEASEQDASPADRAPGEQAEDEAVAGAPEGVPAAPEEAEASDEDREEPIRLEEPQPARSKRPDEGSDGSLRELFWGEE